MRLHWGIDVLELYHMAVPSTFYKLLLAHTLKVNCDSFCFPSARISGIPKLGMLREGLKLFIDHFLLKSILSQGAPEKAALLSERSQLATKAMEAKETKLKL